MIVTMNQALKMTFMSVLLLTIQSMAWAADRVCYLKHSSGMVAGRRSDGRAVIFNPSSAETVKLSLRPVGDGYYLIVHKQTNGTETYMTLNGSWNTYFEDDSSTDKALYAIDGNETEMFRLRNKSNGRYLGTDANDSGSNIYSDKDGNDTKHYWYFSDEKDGKQPTLSESYLVVPSDRRQKNEGWGVSLCWWARMCGAWDDAKIDQIVDWLTSPTGLNYNIFRYNIGGGDDPENRNCDPHHMGRGKGLRAEMEGFKTSSDADYDWTRDEGQRKIMLKIREKRPDAIFEAFSNSCPYYMTYSGCCSGNVDGGKDNLKPEYYEEFAHYLVDVCKHYKDTYGIEFATLEPFNESATSFWYANGPQEGCHFDGRSQIAFIKVLAPILKASGLNTVISSSDETSVPISVSIFEEYQRDGKVLDLVGQWNTHTYSADDVSRSRIGSLARSEGKKLWMSETGSGGNGIGGNLALTQRMFSDIRMMLPSAWVDWQYVEEANDQWCTVRGSFEAQTYSRVKNYYVRQQVTRHIKQGYSFVSSLSPHSLAAVNEAGDTLVLVLLNASATQSTHNIQLTDCKTRGSITCYQTTEAKNHQRTTTGIKSKEEKLEVELPAQSITTLLIPISMEEPSEEEMLVRTDTPYLILPQYSTEVALQAKNKKVTVESIQWADSLVSPLSGESEGSTNDSLIVDASQQWYFVAGTNGRYALRNANGDVLAASSSYALLTTNNYTGANYQLFNIESVDGVFCKITSSSNKKSLDLSNSQYAAGTQVGLWDYGNVVTNGHRNWYLLPLRQASKQSDAILATENDARSTTQVIYNVMGIQQSSASKGINIIRLSNGTVKKVFRK